MDTKTKIGCVVIFVSVLISPILSVINGLVLSQLWAWFIMPLFKLPELPVGFAIGLAIIVSYLTYHANINSKEEEEKSTAHLMTDTVTTYLYSFVRPVTTLFFAWLIHSLFIH